MNLRHIMTNRILPSFSIATLLLSASAQWGCEGPQSEVREVLSVTNWYPSGGANCVPRETNIWITFSQPLSSDTITDSSIELLDGNSVVPASREYDPLTRTVRLSPDAILDFDTSYRIQLDASLATEAQESEAQSITLSTGVTNEFTTIAQTGCADGLTCLVDADCGSQICSVTGVCVDTCAVAEDCVDSAHICTAGECVES